MGDERALGTIGGTVAEPVVWAMRDDVGPAAGAAQQGRFALPGGGCSPARPVYFGRSAWRVSEAGRTTLCGRHARLGEQRDSRRIISTRAIYGEAGLSADWV